MKLFCKRHKPYVTKEGYIQVYKPNSPMARDNGYVAKHRLIASKMLRRPLSSDEIVHHIDGNKQNNRRNNLQVMTPSEHWRVHHPRKYKYGKRRSK